MPYKDPERQREFHRLRRRARRAEYFAGKSCARCGSTERLELDHIDRSTKISHAVWSWSAHRRADELAKCQVLCHECHKTKTIGELSMHHTHGTAGRYKKGCRCTECRGANAAYRRDRRARGLT